MKTLIVGDIHGCFQEFVDLLEAAGLSDQDRIVSVGDIVDRGPDAKKVLAYFRDTPTAIALMGNHERKHLAVANGTTEPARSQRLQRVDFGDDFYEEALALMATFPYFLELEDALVVHGFFEPGRIPDEQDDHILAGTMRAQKRFESRYECPWYELYDYHKPIVVGHLNYNGDGTPLIHQDRVYGIDTGCCHGQRLTGLLLPDFRIVSVPARANHWLDTRRRHYSPEQQLSEDLRLPWKKVEGLIAAATPDSSLPGFVRLRITALATEVERIDQALLKFHDHLTAEARRLLAEIPDHQELPQNELGRKFAQLVGGSPFAHFLHRAKNGKMTVEYLKSRLKTPGNAVDFLEDNRHLLAPKGANSA